MDSYKNDIIPQATHFCQKKKIIKTHFFMYCLKFDVYFIYDFCLFIKNMRHDGTFDIIFQIIFLIPTKTSFHNNLYMIQHVIFMLQNGVKMFPWAINLVIHLK